MTPEVLESFIREDLFENTVRGQLQRFHDDTMSTLSRTTSAPMILLEVSHGRPAELLFVDVFRNQM